MALTYTSDELITAVRNKGMFPNTTAEPLSDANILEALTQALHTVLVPELMRVKEEYCVFSSRIQLAANTNVYRIPWRAMGNKLRDVYWVDSTGNRVQLNPIERDELWKYNGKQADPDGFYIEGNYIKLLPATTGTNGYIEVSYYLRPGDLVATTAARQIATVNATTRQITTASSVPAGWTTANKFDIHSQYSGAEIKIWDSPASVVSGTNMTLDHPLDGTASFFIFGAMNTVPVELGDWVCLASEAVIPAIPRDFHPVLVRATCARIAESLGDAQQVQLHESLLKRDLDTLNRLMQPRVDSKTRSITGSNSVLWS